MAESVFGCKPIVLSLPYRETLAFSSQAGFTMIIAGCNQQIADAFKAHKTFWLNCLPARNEDVNGFLVQPETMPTDQRLDWERIAPTTIVRDTGSHRVPTDDWPFLYLSDMLMPDLSVSAMMELGFLGLAMVCPFLPKSRGRLRFDGRMFFLDAAFMLLETKAVVQLALLFGSTWIVNSLVFFTALILILLANLFVPKAQPPRLGRHYAGLVGLLVAAIAIPFDVFLSGGILLTLCYSPHARAGPDVFCSCDLRPVFSRFH